MTIAFDVDGTLITFDDKPRYDVIDKLIWFAGLNDGLNIIYVHSGGGVDYAKHWVNKLGLTEYVDKILCKSESKQYNIDIAFDDETVYFGKVNIRV